MTLGLFRRKPVPLPATTTAVLLAGGRSERFGSTKGLAKLQDRPLVQWSARLAAAVAKETILVLAPDADATTWRRAVGQTLPQSDAKEGSLHIVHDKSPYSGPVVGLETAVPQVQTPFVLILAVDMPLLRPDLVLGLTERLVGHDAVAYHLEGWWRPMPSLWRKEALQMALQRAARDGTRSLHALFDLVDARPLGPEFLALFDVEGSALQSVNTPADLEAVARRLSG